EPHESADDLTEERGEVRVHRSRPAERLCGLPARERLARRSCRRLITGLPILPATVSALRDVERYRDQCAFHLIPERRRASAELWQEGSEPTNEFKRDRIDLECHWEPFLVCPLLSRTTLRRRRAQTESRLLGSEATEHRRLLPPAAAWT